MGSDSFFVFELFSRQHFVLLREIVECEVNAGEFASRDVEVARRRCACAETPGVKAFGEFFRVDGGGSDEADALSLHDAEAAVNHRFLEFEVRNAVAQESSDLFFFFEDGHVVAQSVQACCGGESGGSGADYADFLAEARIGLRLHPSFSERRFNHGTFVFADGDRGIDGKFQHATLLAEGGADSSCELREVIGGGEDLICLSPVSFEERVLKFGRSVAQRTSPVAEGDAAVHAARGLQFSVARVESLFNFAEVGNSFVDGTVARTLAGYGQECFWISHFDLCYCPKSPQGSVQGEKC